MSTCKGACCGQDPMFPPPGIPEFKPSHDFPTRFSNFHWWNEIQDVNTDVCYRSIRRDELPIPPLHEEMWRYPYRYTSAKPAIMGGAWLSKLKVKEKHQEKKPIPPPPRKKQGPKMDPRDIRQAKGYETTSMDAALQPFLYTTPRQIIRRDTPSCLLTRTWAPRCAHTYFGEYVLNALHPDYRTDPKTNTRIKFNSRDSTRELCAKMKEALHSARKIKKKGFLFSQQYSTGHTNAKLEPVEEN